MVLAGVMHQAFEMYGVITNYQDNGIGYFLLTVIDTLEKDNEKQ